MELNVSLTVWGGSSVSVNLVQSAADVKQVQIALSFIKRFLPFVSFHSKSIEVAVFILRPVKECKRLTLEIIAPPVLT